MEKPNQEQSNKQNGGANEAYIKYLELFEDGNTHAQSLPLTLQLINSMSEKFNSLEKSTIQIENKVDYITTTLKDHIIGENLFRDKQEEYRKEQDKKTEDYRKEQNLIIQNILKDKADKEDVALKANRWVETVLTWGGSAVGLCIIGALMALVLKKGI